jgi:magnesium-protoporphyrin O-methyltransferase
VLGHARERADEALALAAVLEARQCDAIVIVGDMRNQPRLIEDLESVHVPVVAVWHGSRHDGFLTVNVDNRRGIEAALNHLTRLGHRRVAFVGDPVLGDIQERQAAYEDFAAKGRIEAQDGYVQHARNSPGGGVGALEVELLKAGAERAVDVELSPYYERAARELWREQGVGDRIAYRAANVAEDGKDVGSADVVIMHRVVCCYPDYDALVGAAADRARRYLVMSFPRERTASRVIVRGLNLVARMLRWEHRSYVHPVAEIIAAAERRGLTPVLERSGRIWQTAALERS